jgi:hypothetical protein
LLKTILCTAAAEGVEAASLALVTPAMPHMLGASRSLTA